MKYKYNEHEWDTNVCLKFRLQKYEFIYYLLISLSKYQRLKGTSTVQIQIKY